MSPDGTLFGFCGPTGATIISPARTLARRSGTSSTHRKALPGLRRCSIRIFADSMYSSHAFDVVGARLAALTVAGQNSVISGINGRAYALNRSQVSYLVAAISDTTG